MRHTMKFNTRIDANSSASADATDARTSRSKVNNAMNRDEHHSRAAQFSPSHHHRGRFAHSTWNKGSGMMFAKRFSARMIAASGIVAFTAIAVTAGVNTVGFSSTPKADRFDTVAERLCADQNWPNISNACITWESASAAPKKVRFVTESRTDEANAVTILARSPATVVAQR
ncbi:hypothetical protein AB7M35_000312 [Amorphus suaedae]